MSDLEDLDNAPFTVTGTAGGNQGGGGASDGGSIGSPLSGGNASPPKRRGRPPSSSRLSGGYPTLTRGASAAASVYLGAAGIGGSTIGTADGDTGAGDNEEGNRGESGGEAAGILRETSRRAFPEPVALPVSGAKRGRPRKVDITEVEEKHVAHGICAIFGGIFTLLTVFDPAHPHKHWLKTTDKVKPISDPTTDWLNTLGEDARRRVQGCLIPAAILGGIAQVVGPDIQIEMELRRLERQQMSGGPMSPPMAPVNTPVMPPVTTLVAGDVTITAPPADL